MESFFFRINWNVIHLVINFCQVVWLVDRLSWDVSTEGPGLVKDPATAARPWIQFWVWDVGFVVQTLWNCPTLEHLCKISDGAI